MKRYSLVAQKIPMPKHAGYSLSVNHKIVITDDGGGIATALASKLRALRYNAEIISHVPAYSDAVILLDGLQTFNDNKDAIACNLRAFRNAREIAQRFTHKGGLFITVQDTGGQFGLSNFVEQQAWSAGLAGLVKTAAIEWPKAICKAIDLQKGQQTAEQLAERLLQEILHGDSERECGLLANQERIGLNIISTEPQVGELSIDKNSVIIVSGGGRGITASCILELAKKIRPRFVLLGRTALDDNIRLEYLNKEDTQLRQLLFKEAQAKNSSITPIQINQSIARIKANQEIKSNIKALQQAGSEVMYQTVDILDETSVREALAKAKTNFGKITGIIHGAGVIADKLITDQSEEQFAHVFNTKVFGLRNLLNATSNDPLEFIGLFSSVAARFGNSGQAAYAMGNEVLNKVAAYEKQRRGKACLVKSYNWGPWDIGMVTPGLKDLFIKRGVSLLSAQQGVKMFMDELNANNDDVEIICGSTLAFHKKANEH